MCVRACVRACVRVYIQSFEKRLFFIKLEILNERVRHDGY